MHSQASADYPVVRLNRVTAEHGAQVRVTLGFFAPGGSSWDAVAERQLDRLPAGITSLVVPSFGDFGSSVALAAARRGWRTRVVAPESLSLERRALLASYGAEVTWVPEGLSWDELLKRADGFPGAFCVVPSLETLREDAEATLGAATAAGGATTVFVCGAGRGGTFLGVRDAIQKVSPEVRAVLVQSAAPHHIQGYGHPETLLHQADRVMTLTDRLAWETRGRLAREEGLLVSLSGAANVAAALAVAAELPPDAIVATLVWSTGEREFSLGTYFP